MILVLNSQALPLFRRTSTWAYLDIMLVNEVKVDTCVQVARKSNIDTYSRGALTKLRSQASKSAP